VFIRENPWLKGEIGNKTNNDFGGAGGEAAGVYSLRLVPGGVSDVCDYGQ
jgi:hypothetical protein